MEVIILRLRFAQCRRRPCQRGFSAFLRMLVIGLVCALTAAGTAEADGNIHIGQLRIHPFLQVSESFSDNIFSAPSGTIRDSIMTYTPGLKLHYEFGRHQADAEYSSVVSRYRTYKFENTTDHNANGSVDLKLGSFIGLKFSDAFTKGHEGRGYSSTGFIEKFKNNNALVSATYQLADRSKVQFDFGKSVWDFVTSTFRDRDETLLSGYLYYRFLPKTSAFIEVDHNAVVFADPRLDLNNTTISTYTGLRWDITEKSKGSIKAGVAKKDFKSPFEKDYDSWTGAIDLHHAFSDYTNLTLLGQRAAYETTIQGASYVVVTGAYGELSHRFLRKLEATVRTSYATNDFSNPVPPDMIIRTDRTGLNSGGIKYLMRDWLAFGVDYTSRVRHSNIPAANYREHVTMISAIVAL